MIDGRVISLTDQYSANVCECLRGASRGAANAGASINGGVNRQYLVSSSVQMLFMFLCEHFNGDDADDSVNELMRPLMLARSVRYVHSVH